MTQTEKTQPRITTAALRAMAPGETVAFGPSPSGVTLNAWASLTYREGCMTGVRYVCARDYDRRMLRVTKQQPQKNID